MNEFLDTILPSAFLLIGAFFLFVAAAGVLRFDDFYARIHAATKASTFGFGFTALAVAWVYAEAVVWGKLVIAVFFLFITLPVAAHLLSRAVLKRTTLDEQMGRKPGAPIDAAPGERGGD